MSTLSVQDALNYARQAGFSGTGLATIVAIAIAESGLQTDIRGQSDPRDRGVLQINSFWHPEVSDACAFDPACAFQSAYRISASGRNFSQWNTYTSGAYQRYLQQAGSNTVGNCPWYCHIPTGIPGLTIATPGADCSGCNQTTQVAPLNKAAQAVGNPNSVIDQSLFNTVLQPLLQALPGIGIKMGLFMFALLLVIVGFWIVAGKS